MVRHFFSQVLRSATGSTANRFTQENETDAGEPSSTLRPSTCRAPGSLKAENSVEAIFKGSFVLDVTANPDFSQVESDEPQITVNRRFEVFFPEKRPFFLENANFFQTPINLLFTRRIADPQWGIRLTGTGGPYALGALVADDEAPGKSVPADDLAFGKRAKFAVFRLQRDISRGSTLGLVFTDREFEGSVNRVGGVDGRLRLNDNWVAAFQGVTSFTRFLDGSRLAGPAYKGYLSHAGQHLYYNLGYGDRSRGFNTEVGFLAENRVNRPLFRSREITGPSMRSDIRSISQYALYQFRPESKWLISWGPTLLFNGMWDRSGTRLDAFRDVGMNWELPGFTYIEVFQTADREVLRPKDFTSLAEDRAFSHRRNGFYAGSQILPQVSLEAEFTRGTGINFRPPEGQAPVLANVTRANLGIILRPLTRLRIDNAYLLERLTDRARGASIFNNHIVRSSWNVQFNRELSLRVILQYDAVLAHRELTALETSRNFNADFLVTYLVNPWTALYVGHNGNLREFDLLSSAPGTEPVRPRGFVNDTRQFFIKFSCLLRF
jgi:hypothetical protein